jgi:hypothetical protein
MLTSGPDNLDLCIQTTTPPGLPQQLHHTAQMDPEMLEVLLENQRLKGRESALTQNIGMVTLSSLIGQVWFF